MVIWCWAQDTSPMKATKINVFSLLFLFNLISTQKYFLFVQEVLEIKIKWICGNIKDRQNFLT